jgi:hypothetical protein
MVDGEAFEGVDGKPVACGCAARISLISSQVSTSGRARSAAQGWGLPVGAFSTTAASSRIPWADAG